MLAALRPSLSPVFLLVAVALAACEPEYVSEAPDGMTVADGLSAMVFAAEPMLSNPTNMDVDARGRVWVIEAQNYRPRLNPENPIREEGDRILILEDTDGDGRADSQQVFYQGSDIDAALGIAVLGEKVIVSAYENVFIFTDRDGDDRPDDKQLFFTGLGGTQHDHGVHAFVFGPDGKLYFNFGNAGDQLHDAQGNIVVDKAGREVRADGNPYRQGMVFRADADGSNLEVLGHNFRNNYEVAVDSYGTLWQSDNDDDGNRGVRINYVMEYGNYGYRDEMTGAGWRTRRTGMEDEIPLQHWHLNDPGVVPNLLQTGAGSPTGILVYEGDLLPQVFHGQVIHADAGPNVVRAYPAEPDGAGYRAEIVNVLKGDDDAWFRPSDVAVGPDGSLFVADWRDPGVGGHQMRDLAQGRIYRIAPDLNTYTVPPFDVSTPESAVKTLKSPNHARRYLAWTALHEAGASAEPALQQLWQDENPRFRARALWLLSKLDGAQGRAYIETALQDENPDVRITALRAARQRGEDVLPYARALVQDPNPQVRREVALALRHHKSPEAATLWAELARQHDGQDRWYLEALGIGADEQWDRYFAAWKEQAGDAWKTPAGQDIVWRSRAPEALPLLADLIGDAATDSAASMRYFRAFDFHEDPSKQEVLVSLLGRDPARPHIALFALKHADSEDERTAPPLQAAVRETLPTVQGTQEFLDLVERYRLSDQNEALLRMALAHPDSSLGTEATRLLMQNDGQALLEEALASGDEEVALAALTALGTVESEPSRNLSAAVMMDENHSLAVREQAVRSIARGWGGENHLLEIVRGGRLPDDLVPVATRVLMSAYRSSVRNDAARYLGVPGDGERAPLPPIVELVQQTGDAGRGKAVFDRTCNSCHLVGNRGIDFGPALTEIGDKLSKEALYTSILYPDAGINFGYEGYRVRLQDGSEVTGYIASETADELTLRLPGGTTQRYPKAEITGRTELDQSLMPPGLHLTMTEQELIDLVAYLETLRSNAVAVAQ